MHNAKRITVLALIIFILIGTGFYLVRLRDVGEPSFQGRSLSSWLQDFEAYGTDLKSPPAIAVQNMGTNALPFLLDILTYEESSFRKQLREMEEKFPLRSSFFQRNYMYEVQAAYALNVMGAIAEPAFPMLTNWLPTKRSVVAGIALAGLGQKGIPPLLQALTNQNKAVQHSAAGALGYTRTDSDLVVSTLVHMLRSKDSHMCFQAAISLGLLRKRPDLAVPAMIEALNTADSLNHGILAHALGEFGASASNAIPALEKILNDPDATTAGLAKRAIENLSAVFPPEEDASVR